MQETLKKAGFCFENHPKATACMRLKICQLLIQGIISLITGLLSISSAGNCSSPINIFLLGLFGIYISGISLNFFICFGRCCTYFGTDSCKSSFKLCMRGLNYLYLPLYWAFCVIEFIWYVLGAYWYSEGGDCSSTFSSGYNATIGLVAFYFILLVIYIIAFVIFMCYLKFNDIKQPENKENKPPNAENTVAFGQNVNQGAGFQQSPNNFAYNQGNYTTGFNQPNQFVGNNQFYQSDPRFNDPRLNQNDPRFNDPRLYQNAPNYLNSPPHQQDPNHFSNDPRLVANQFAQNDPRLQGFYNSGPQNFSNYSADPQGFYNQRNYP